MKKLILSICLMCTLLLSTTAVFAATIDVSDTEYFRIGYADNDETILPLNLEECAGETKVNSQVQGTIIVKGKWILRNNGIWSYSESFTTSGTSSLYDYKGKLTERLGSRFNYTVTESKKSDESIRKLYLVTVYMVCDL